MPRVQTARTLPLPQGKPGTGVPFGQGKRESQTLHGAKRRRLRISAAFLGFLAAMRALLPLLIGSALWSYAGWSAHPRELWDAPAFQPVWLIATLAAGMFGGTRDSKPMRDTGLIFLPIFGALTVSTLLTGGSASLLPLGILAVILLALPGLALAWVVKRVAVARR